MHGNIHNLINMQFGKLTVLKILKERLHGCVVWQCQCECGKITKVTSSNLRRGDTTSCGCLHKERFKESHTLPKGTAAFNKLYGRYCRSARLRKLAFKITKEDFKKITKQNCHYCGRPPLNTVKDRKIPNGEYLHNGIDRIDNIKGYTKTNCVACCKECNYMKRTLSVDKFIIHIKKIYSYLSK